MRNTSDCDGLNCQMISPKIQKDLVRCCVEEIIQAISIAKIEEVKFPVLIDYSLRFFLVVAG
jgi:hypothetical protein